MVEDALEGDRTVGIVLLRPGYEEDYHGRPPIYPLGCSGLIVEQERLDDGRFNVLLLGQSRFRVTGEREGRPYRVADVEELPDAVGDASSVGAVRERLLGALARLASTESTVEIQGDVSHAALVNALSQGLDLPPVEKLALLGCDTVESRAARLAEILDYHALERRAGGSGSLH